MTGPSPKALDEGREGFKVLDPEGRVREAAVRAAYPTIRADVIAEVVAALRDVWRMSIPPDVTHPADFIERELGGKS